MEAGYGLPEKYIDRYLVIQELYRQQKLIFDNKTHSVENRIVSIRQIYIRPIVRGKSKSPVEFGAKYDISIDEKGHARLEKYSFDLCHESSVPQNAVERYRERTGHYPRRILVDQICQTRENITYCKEHHIEMSGPKLGRRLKNQTKPSEAEKQDNKDRSEVERFFSVDKRCSGAGLITEAGRDVPDDDRYCRAAHKYVCDTDRAFFCALFLLVARGEGRAILH